MQHAEFTRTIHAPIAQVWPLLADVTAVARWSPAVDKADLLTVQSAGLRAARRCHFYDGTSVREEVIAVADGRRVRVRLTESSMPMKRLEAEFIVAETPEGHTKVTMALDYEVKWGLLGKLMGAMMVRGQLVKMETRALAGLNHYVTTGAVVGKDFVVA